MKSNRTLAALAVAAAMVASGCLSSDAPAAPLDTQVTIDDHHDDGHNHDDGDTDYSNAKLEYLMPDFQVDLTGCREGGGVSIYNSAQGTNAPAAPFLYDNIRQDLGDPRVASYWQPITSDWLHGIWHMTWTCDSYTYQGEDRNDFWGGWVGVRVEPPPWDDGTIERQYLIPDISFLDGQIAADLQAGLMMHASRMLEGKIDWVGPAAMHQVMDDEDHGVFQTHMDMEPAGKMDVPAMRFWVMVDLSGAMNQGHDHDDEGSDDSPAHMTGFRPVAIDIVNSKQGNHYTAVDGTGLLSHTRTSHHGATGGAAGNVGGILWDGIDRTMTIGPSPDIVLEETWLH